MRSWLPLVIPLFLFSLLIAGCGGSRKNAMNTLVANDYSTTVTLVRTTPATTRIQSPLHVTLTAKNHHPHPSESPTWHWWYCVKIGTAGGKAVPAPVRLHVQILLGRTPVEDVALVYMKKGYHWNHAWCGAIGGEGNVLDAAPRGKRLDFQAVVKAMGVTFRRNFPIIVR
jgi:hypothetical protein